MHSILCLHKRVRPKYKASLVARWNVDPIEDACFEVDDDVKGLVGLSLEALQLDIEATHQIAQQRDKIMMVILTY